jgi:broad specificity phosphatase PhoE
MLWLARHGQTAENARGLLLGRADPPLSEVGRRQAVALARVVPPEGRVVSSPLRRARETAEALGRPVEIDERWIELDYGTLDGCRPADVDEAVWERWRSDPSYVPAGGESLTALGERVREACRQLTTDARDHDVVVVSHVSPIKAAIAWALQVGDAVAWRMFVRDGSIARIRIDSWGTVLVSFNEVPPIP